MEQLEFQAWWTDFQSYHKSDKDGGLETLKHLKQVVAGFSEAKRIAFIDEMINNDLGSLATELIALYGNEYHRRLIRDKFKEWITSQSENSIADAYLMTILRTFEESDITDLRKYFIEQRGNWFRIPIELYSIDRVLFIESFEILLKRWTDESVFKYDGLLYLTNHLDILEFLIDNLSVLQSKRLQKFCKIKSGHSYVNTDKRKIGLLTLANKILQQPTSQQPKPGGASDPKQA